MNCPSLGESSRHRLTGPNQVAKAAVGCGSPVPKAGTSDVPVNQLPNHSGVLSGGKE